MGQSIRRQRSCITINDCQQHVWITDKTIGGSNLAECEFSVMYIWGIFLMRLFFVDYLTIKNSVYDTIFITSLNFSLIW